ncbi:MAG TPA: HAMP domain-containing sensor histidine kinase [Cyclobacteriaceae bacterium]|jgi:signal transduction histidine kinase|nr:HAMP domain-containing sensor histidine kinase [Cyclobacteriaceae bacterium]
MIKRFRKQLLGKKAKDSDAEVRRIMLTAFMAVTSFFAEFIFLLINLLSHVYYWVPANVIVMGICIACLFLIRRAHYKTAKLLLVVTLNLMIFWSASIDPFDDGTYLLFIPVGIGAFALLDSRNLKTAITLATFSTALFLLSYFDIAVNYELPPLSPQYHQAIFLLTYLFSFALSIAYVYFLVHLNFLSERELILKENFAHQKNEQLQQANKSLDQLVYSVSHDLRSPLNSILGLIQLAQQAASTQESDRLLKMIKDRIHVQNNYIKEVIDYTRNSKSELRIEKIALKLLVDEIIESLRYGVDALKIDFRNQVSMATSLLADRMCLWIALNNLIGNAIKYHDMHKEKPIIEIGYTDHRDSIYVLDNGSGILPEHQKKIFNMFYRGSDKSGGSGLGLHIIKEAVEKIGGRIEVDSVLGVGSKFEIYLDRNMSSSFQTQLYPQLNISTNSAAQRLKPVL